MTRLCSYSVVFTALIAISTLLSQGFGFTPPLVNVTAEDIARLDSTMASATAYTDRVDTRMRVCYTEIASLRYFAYMGSYIHIYRLKACMVPTVLAPKCSTTQLSACTPEFFSFIVNGSEPVGRIIDVHRNVDQGPSDLPDITQGRTESPGDSTPSSSPATSSLGSATNSTEAGVATAPSAAVPTATPKQSGSVSVSLGGVSLACVVAALVITLTSI